MYICNNYGVYLYLEYITDMHKHVYVCAYIHVIRM